MLNDFLVRAMLAGVGVAIVAGPIGCFIVWRRMAYFGETIAHSAPLGVAIAILTDVHLLFGVLFIACAVVIIMIYLETRDTLPTDTLLGMMSHGGLALGLVTLSFFPAIRIDIHALLFGDILAVDHLDLLVVWLGGLLALLALGFIWRPLVVATVNEDLAAVAGFRPERARLVFGLLLAIVISAAIKIVGILLIVALMIIPAATVRRFATSPEFMAVAAAVAGVFAVGGGLFTSATLDTPSGPSVVVAALVLFIVSRLFPHRET